MDITGIVDLVKSEIDAAKAYSSDDNESAKIPLRDQSMGISSKNFSVVYTPEELSDYGLTAKEVSTLQSLASKVRATYVSRYGESSGSFDTKPGTKYLASLKALSDAGILDAEGTATYQALDAEWRSVAPLRGLASLSDEERQARAAARKAAKAEAAAQAVVAEANAQ